MNIKEVIGTTRDSTCKYCLHLGKPECDDECKDKDIYSKFERLSRITDIVPLGDGKLLRIMF